ncbi:MAG: hypothetical protein OXD36_00470 [Rhodobacter sp.]|nr:hypothetical protein [Rhodobacter sp.]
MSRIMSAVFVLCTATTTAIACDDHHGTCEIEAWRFQNTMGVLTIEGSATCNSGRAMIRLYDGETYLGNAIGFVEGHALSAVATGIEASDNLSIKYSIEPM